MIRNTVLRLALVATALVAISGCCCEGAEGVGDVVDIAGGGFKFYQKISSAPGTTQLKKAGCEQAFVITPEALADFVGSIEKVAEKNKEEGVEATTPPELKFPMVMCQVQKAKKAPKCDDIAKTYGEAVKETPQFGVIVQAGEKRDGPVCQGLFKEDGTRISDLPKGDDGKVDTSFMPEK